MRDEIMVTWLGQAGFALRTPAGNLLIDPWLSAHPDRTAEAPNVIELPRSLVAVLATHEHLDHLDIPSLPFLLGMYPGTMLVVPDLLVELVQDKIGDHAGIVGLRPGEWLQLDERARVLACPAWHGVTVADGYSDGGWSQTGSSRFIGYIIETAGLRIYHSGDTLATPELVDFLRPLGVDVAILPINGRDAKRERQGIVGNMNAAEALALASEIGAGLLVPMHYDMVRGNRAPVSQVVDLASRQRGAPRVWVLARHAEYVVPILDGA